MPSVNRSNLYHKRDIISLWPNSQAKCFGCSAYYFPSWWIHLHKWAIFSNVVAFVSSLIYRFGLSSSKEYTYTFVVKWKRHNIHFLVLGENHQKYPLTSHTKFKMTVACSKFFSIFKKIYRVCFDTNMNYILREEWNFLTFCPFESP